MMNQEQVEKRINDLLIELNALKSIINYESEEKEEKEDFVIAEEEVSLKEEKLKFMRAYQNIPMKDVIPLFNKKFHTNYDRRAGGYFYGLREKALNPIKAEEKKKDETKGIHTRNKEKFEKMKELMNQNLNNTQIAKELGITSLTIGVWRKKLNNKNPNERGFYKKSKFNKNNIIRYLKIYYFGTPKEKDDLMKELNINWSNLGKYISKAKQSHKPQEIGLTRFPSNVTEYKNIEYLKIK